MALNGINGILGTGGRKTAHRGEKRGNKDLVGPDQRKKKADTALLQKIIHASVLPISGLLRFTKNSQAV